ncbi:MAG: aminotransferase class IV [Candidatus Eisenbacteria bacterium]
MTPLALALDGRLVPPDGPVFPPLERGLLYGDGLFESFAVFHGHPVDGARHFERLAASCDVLGFPRPDREAWDRAIALCLGAVGSTARAVRATWTRGFSTARGYAPDADAGPPRLLVAAYAAPDDEAPRRRQGVSAAPVRDLAPGDLARHKTLSAMTYVVAQARARAAGADEAILVDESGRLLESAGANLFVRTGAGVLTPPAARPILPGLTRALVLGWLGDAGREADLKPEDLAGAHEAFLTNSVRGIVPLLHFDGGPIGPGEPGEVTRELLERWGSWCAGVVEENRPGQRSS